MWYTCCRCVKEYEGQVVKLMPLKHAQWLGENTLVFPSWPCLKLWFDLKNFTVKECQCCLFFMRVGFSLEMHRSRSVDGSRKMQIAFPYLRCVLQRQPRKQRAVGVPFGARTESRAGNTINDAVFWKQFKVPVRIGANFRKAQRMCRICAPGLCDPGLCSAACL